MAISPQAHVLFARRMWSSEPSSGYFFFLLPPPFHLLELDSKLKEAWKVNRARFVECGRTYLPPPKKKGLELGLEVILKKQEFPLPI